MRCFDASVFLFFAPRARVYIIRKKTDHFCRFDTFCHPFALFYKKVVHFVAHIWGRTPKMHKKGKKR